MRTTVAQLNASVQAPQELEGSPESGHEEASVACRTPPVISLNFYAAQQTKLP